MTFLTLGERFGVDDRGAPGGVSGWGIPGWAGRRSQMFTGVTRFSRAAMKPVKVGARYFCGDCDSTKKNEPVAAGNKYTSSKAAYQEAVTAHYAGNHPDLHYPIDQAKADAKAVADKAKARAAYLAMMKAGVAPVKGGIDVSAEYLAVTRPRELPDFTEFDFPDANLADAGSEEIELDQLISIAARQGRRFLGAEIQNIATELGAELIGLAADNDLSLVIQLNTRTGTQNLDDPENLWRHQIHAPFNVTNAFQVFKETNGPPPGGQVYVAPRLFWRVTNNLDRQIDTGDLITRIASVTQTLSTFLLFELLEQYSGLFGFAA